MLLFSRSSATMNLFLSNLKHGAQTSALAFACGTWKNISSHGSAYFSFCQRFLVTLFQLTQDNGTLLLSCTVSQILSLVFVQLLMYSQL